MYTLLMRFLTAPILAALLLQTAAAQTALAADTNVITLRDGTVITGEVVSLIGGLYTVQSDTLGAVTVRQSDIVSMTRGDAATTAGRRPAVPEAPTRIDELQQRMASDPETMKAVSALQDNPEIKELLDDPEVLKALQSGDLEVLLANPKLARLAADPKVQEITRKLAQ